MQHPLELGAAHYFPAEAFPDHRSHRYRSFMIEEILTDPPDAKGAAPAGELLKFGVQALLSARPYHNHLGTCCRGAGPPPGSGLRAPGTAARGVPGPGREQAPGCGSPGPRCIGAPLGSRGWRAESGFEPLLGSKAR